MQSLQDATVINNFKKRIDTLKPDSQHQWGKMDVSQMMAHCSQALEINFGTQTGKQSFMGKIFGKVALKSILSDKPFKKDLPTAPGFKVVGEKEFNKEKQRLLGLLQKLQAADMNKLAEKKHPFFGTITADQWNTLISKHLDHHLKQFGA